MWEAILCASRDIYQETVKIYFNRGRLIRQSTQSRWRPYKVMIRLIGAILYLGFSNFYRKILVVCAAGNTWVSKTSSLIGKFFVFAEESLNYFSPFS